jgi:hypothetical protein
MCHCKNFCSSKIVIKSKIKCYYKFSELMKSIETNVGNLRIYGFQGPIYSDINCTQILGSIFMEQTLNINTNMAKTTQNINLPDGVISCVFFNKTDGIHEFNNGNNIGPINYGTKKYLFWNSSQYFSNINAENNLRTVSVYKKYKAKACKF